MKIRFSIRTKLVAIINTVLLLAAAAIVGFATHKFSGFSLDEYKERSLLSTRSHAREIFNSVAALNEKMRLTGVTLLQPLTPEQLETVQRPLFDQEKEILAVTVISLGGEVSRPLGRANNDRLLKDLEVQIADIDRLQAQVDRTRLASRLEVIQSGLLRGSVPVLTMGVPLITDDKGNVTHAVIATFKQDRFLKTFSDGSGEASVGGEDWIISYLVDSSGTLLAHPDQSRVVRRENLRHISIVSEMLNQGGNKLTEFKDNKGTEWLGAYETIGFGGIGVVTQIKKQKALETSRQVRNISVIITGMVGVIAFLFIYFFSSSLTRPITRLVDATTQVSKGNYEVTLTRGANDEIGDLTVAFSSMAQGLAEREKIKSAFSKFHSKDVADKILSGELTLTGERKKVTIFFSDIRSFTSISEGLEPEQVVELVNGYMTRMVRIIFAHGGVVDKYVGDAIMAVYGAPTSYGDDALRAVSAAIRMRAELKRFNESQAALGKPVIAIGMGMNTGDVVAGNIGSPERMEYTILGDSVNLTSRVESLTKEYKTDILISSSTYEEIKDQIHCEPRGTTKVKGKAEEVFIYEVIGFKEGREFIPPETGSTGESVEPEAVNSEPQSPTPPVEAPVVTSAETPVEAPAEAQLEAPTVAPVEAQLEAPTVAPIEAVETVDNAAEDPSTEASSPQLDEPKHEAPEATRPIPTPPPFRAAPPIPEESQALETEVPPPPPLVPPQPPLMEHPAMPTLSEDVTVELQLLPSQIGTTPVSYPPQVSLPDLEPVRSSNDEGNDGQDAA